MGTVSQLFALNAIVTYCNCCFNSLFKGKILYWKVSAIKRVKNTCYTSVKSNIM